MTAGRVVVVTGASRGLGHTGACRIAADGAGILVVTARTAGRAAQAATVIGAAAPATRVHGVALDLSSWASVTRAAAEILDLGPRLDVLVANAAVLPPRRRTESIEGRELVMATDHLGHFLLTALLLPRLRATAANHGQARVVVISSRLHHPRWPGPQPRFDVEDLDLRHTPYRPMRAYRRAKLANLLFAFELERRERRHGVRAVALCPGFIPDATAENITGWHGVMHRYVFPTLPFARTRAAAAAAYAHAVSAPLNEVGGCFLGDTEPITPSRQARDPELAARLWTVSQQWTSYPTSS